VGHTATCRALTSSYRPAAAALLAGLLHGYCISLDDSQLGILFQMEHCVLMPSARAVGV
jgi:hypothetical protein